MKIAGAAAAAATMLWAVTVNGNLDVLGRLSASQVDFSGAASTAPMKTGTSLPVGCSIGQAFFKRDAMAGQNIYLCTAADTWTQVQGGGGESFNWKPSPQFVMLRTDFALGYNLGTPAYFGDFAFVRASGTQNLNMVTVGHDGRLGVINVSTNTTSGNRSLWQAAFSWSSSDSDTLYSRTNQEWEMVYVFRYHGAADAANSVFYSGIMQGSTDNPQRGVGIRYIAGTDTQFVFFANSSPNAWGSTAASGASPDTNWHKVRIRSDGTQTYRMWISLDGGTERSICPSGCDLTLGTYLNSSAMQSFGINIATNEGAQKSVDFDYLYLWMNWGTR